LAQQAEPKVDRATAYYYYAMGHLYADLAANSNNRPAINEYVNKAIDNYKLAIQADPKSSVIAEELSEIYIASGRFREAQTDAEEALRKNPNDLAAHRMLARIYMRQIGGEQQNRIDEAMLKKAMAEFQKITEIEPKDVDAWILLGRLYRASQSSPEAERAFKKALEIDDKNEEALSGLADVYIGLGDNKRAADLLGKIDSPRAFAKLAEAYKNMHEYALAAETLRKLLSMNPPNANDVKRELVENLVAADQLPEALKTLEEVVADEPNDAQSYLWISRIHLQQRNFAKAREASAKATAISPNDPDVRYQEVSILIAEGKTPEAIQTLNGLLESTSHRNYNAQERGVRLDLLQKLAGLYRLADQTDNAVGALRKMIDLDSTVAPGVTATIIETLREGKEFQKAEQEANAAIKKWPDDKDLRVTHARLMADLGKLDAGIAEVKPLLDGKNDRRVYVALAELYDKGKRFDEEAKALDQAEKMTSAKEEMREIWFTRGAMFEKQKKMEAAEAEFRKVLEADPDNAGAMNYLGYMLADRNVRLQEALQLITKALAKDPNNGAYLDSLGWVYFRLGRLNDAEENLRQAIARTPRDPTVHDHMGDVLAKQSKLKEAIVQWQASLKEWDASSPADQEPTEIAKVRTKLENAKVRLAKESPKNN
jgi:tetratricopeptide (TPR) repeat protein